MQMELRSITSNPLNGLFPAQSEADLLRGFSMPEIWKDVVGYEGLYEVSDMGNVRKLPTKTIMSQHISPKGYCRLFLRKNGKSTGKSVHRLVLESFKGLKNGTPVNHIDKIKRNNRLDNLEATTNRENITHYYGSKFTGAYKTKHGISWRSEIRVNGKRHYLGCFPSQEMAHEAYVMALQKMNIKNKYAAPDEQKGGEK